MEKKLKMWTSVGVVVIVLILSVIVIDALMPDRKVRESPPLPPLESSLKISEPPSLNSTANVTFECESKTDITNDSIVWTEIALPSVYGDGLQWIGNKPKWNGGLMKGDEFQINGTVKATKEGKWPIKAPVFRTTDDNYSIGWEASDGDVQINRDKSENITGIMGGSSLYISVSSDSAHIISEESFSEYYKEDEENPDTNPTHPDRPLHFNDLDRWNRLMVILAVAIFTVTSIIYWKMKRSRGEGKKTKEDGRA